MMKKYHRPSFTLEGHLSLAQTKPTRGALGVSYAKNLIGQRSLNMQHNLHDIYSSTIYLLLMHSLQSLSLNLCIKQYPSLFIFIMCVLFVSLSSFFFTFITCYCIILTTKLVIRTKDYFLTD